MPPLTLAILASVLQMQGADATLASDNKGVEEVLADIRGSLQEQVDPNSSATVVALISNYSRTLHAKGTYVKKTYSKNTTFEHSSPATPGANISTKPGGGGHR